jgi:hypothetical protein
VPFPFTHPNPRYFSTTTHDTERHQQGTLQQPEEYSQDEQLEEEDFVLDVDFTSSKTEQHASFSAEANVSLLQCKNCQKEYQHPGQLK